MLLGNARDSPFAESENSCWRGSAKFCPRLEIFIERWSWQEMWTRGTDWLHGEVRFD